MQTRRLHESFEGSYSSLPSSSGELSQFIVVASGRLMHFLQFSDFGAKRGFLGHNFGSRHARRSSKGSIDAEDLVSKTSLSQNFGPWDWRPGRVKVGQKTENTRTLRASPRRIPHPNQKMFFFGRTKKTFRIRRGFEHLCSWSGWRVTTKKLWATIVARAVGKGTVLAKIATSLQIRVQCSMKLLNIFCWAALMWIQRWSIHGVVFWYLIRCNDRTICKHCCTILKRFNITEKYPNVF